MLTLGQQKIEPLSLAVIICLVAAAVGVGFFDPAMLPWSVGLLASAVVIVFWSLKWDITAWAWLWVLSYGLLDWPEWKIELAGFFNLTIPRLIFMVSLVGFSLYFLFHRRRVRFDRGLLWVMLALVLYLTFSLHTTGWVARTHQVRTAPYYRFIGSILLPFTMFFMLYNTGSREKQIRRALVMITVFGWYALYIGYLQYASIQGVGWARGLIWPGYINDPQFGIHFDRARGPFAAASPQAVFMILLFYVDLYLIRKIRGPLRMFLIAQVVLIPAAIFFTLLRSAYLSFLICGIIWIFFAGSRQFRWQKAALFLLVILLVTYGSWSRLRSTDRAAGGVAQRGPVRARQILVAQTWTVFKQAPLTGVGFGKWVDALMATQRDPSSLVGATTGVLVQHNLFLNMVAETGLIGLTLIVTVFVLLFRQSRQLYRKLPPNASGDLCRDFVVLFWVVMANYLANAMFRDPLWDVFSNGMLWCFAGLVVCFNRLLEPYPLDLPIAPRADTA